MYLRKKILCTRRKASKSKTHRHGAPRTPTKKLHKCQKTLIVTTKILEYYCETVTRVLLDCQTVTKVLLACKTGLILK